MKRLGKGPAEDMLNTVVDKGVSFPGKVAEAVRSRKSFACEPESTSSVTLSQRNSARSGPPVMPSPKVLQYMSNPSNKEAVAVTNSGTRGAPPGIEATTMPTRPGRNGSEDFKTSEEVQTSPRTSAAARQKSCK